MHRTARTLLVLVTLLAAACSTASSARHARLRRGLDEARVSRTPAEIWPEVLRFLQDSGYPVVGDDRVVIGLRPQGAVARVLSRGYETRVGSDGRRVLETDQNRERLRVRAEARPAPEGGSRVRLVVLKEIDLNSMDVSERSDEDLELALLRRLDPVAAARAAGEPLPADTSAAAPAQDPWAGLRPLLGSWEGAGPAGARVHWAFSFIDGGKFVEVRGSPLLFAGPTARADAGEELGRVARDAAGGRLVWNQFTYGGRVDRWLAEAPGAGPLVFVADAPESLPPGARARLTLASEAGAILARLELAEPGKDLAPAGEVRLQRERDR